MKQIGILFFTFLGNCAGFAQKPDGLFDSNTVKEKPSIRLFPNPAKNKVEIEVNGFMPGNLQVQLIDEEGNMVKNEKRYVFTGKEIIVLMFSERPGLYFLLLKQGKILFKRKLIIQ